MKMLNKKGQANVMTGLTAFVMGIVALAMVLAIGLLVLQEVQTATLVGGVAGGNSTIASNATGSIVTKLATAPTWIGILIIVGFATVVLSLFYVTRR